MKKIKSSMLIVMIAIGFASFVSCNNNKNAQTADGSDSTAVVNEALEDQEVAEMSAFINSVASCLDSIQVQENMIFNHPEGTTDKQHMLTQLRSFKELLARPHPYGCHQEPFNTKRDNFCTGKYYLCRRSRCTECGYVRHDC